MTTINIKKLNDGLKDLTPPPFKDKWEEVYNEMIVHTRGAPPGDILLRRRPNEDPEVQQYREDTYEPITMGAMNRAIDKLFRMFISANFSISVSDGLEEYLKAKKFKRQYFYPFIQKYVVRRMIEDPNGFLAWIPAGDGMTDPTKKVEVEPLMIYSKDIHHMSEESITWLSKEKSDILFGGEIRKEGKVYYTLTSQGYYKHTQTGNKTEEVYNLTILYEHKLGVLPAIVLGGDLSEEDYYKSYFYPFVPFGNETIRQYSDWVGVMTTTGFPYREEEAEDCTAKGCKGGYITKKSSDPAGEPTVTKCRACGGSGRRNSRSPYGVFLRAKGGNIMDPNSPPPTGSRDPMVRFISPDVAIIKESRAAWEILLEKAENALCLDKIDQAQSGKAKEKDQEDSFMVLTKVSNNVFDEVIFQSLKIIEGYREISKPQDPEIIKPISFSIKTEMDLIEEITTLTDKNAPVAFLVESTKDLAKKRFSGNKIIARMVEILVTYDPIYHMSSKDKQVFYATGIIKKEDLIKSMFAYKVLNTLVSKTPLFLEQDMEKIFAAIDTAMTPILASYTAEETDIDLTPKLEVA